VRISGYEISDHARDVIAERQIGTTWVVRGLRSKPERIATRKSTRSNIRLDGSKVVDSDEVKPGIVLDFNAKKEVVGIEVLDVKRRVRKADLKQLKILVA